MKEGESDEIEAEVILQSGRRWFAEVAHFILLELLQELKGTQNRTRGERGNTSQVKSGDPSYRAEGLVNIAIGERSALRVMGFYKHDGGYNAV